MQLRQVVEWLTGSDEAALEHHLAAGATFDELSAAARLDPAASLITGTTCGHRVEEIADPLVQEVRHLDELVDELARGRAVDECCARRPVRPRRAARGRPPPRSGRAG